MHGRCQERLRVEGGVRTALVRAVFGVVALRMGPLRLTLRGMLETEPERLVRKARKHQGSDKDTDQARPQRFHWEPPFA